MKKSCELNQILIVSQNYLTHQEHDLERIPCFGDSLGLQKNGGTVGQKAENGFEKFDRHVLGGIRGIMRIVTTEPLWV